MANKKLSEGVGKKIVEDNMGKVFEKGENGAIIFKGEKFGLHTRVFINSEGIPTYEAKDLANALIKYKKYKYDKIFFFEPWKEIFINDSERKETFEQTEEISKYLIEGYKSMNYNLIIVPKLPTKERMNFIINYK